MLPGGNLALLSLLVISQSGKSEFHNGVCLSVCDKPQAFLIAPLIVTFNL